MKHYCYHSLWCNDLSTGRHFSFFDIVHELGALVQISGNEKFGFHFLFFFRNQSLHTYLKEIKF